jgi:hypothetical protein
MMTHNVPKHVTSYTALEIVEEKLIDFSMTKNANYVTVEIQTVFCSDEAITTLGLQLTIPMQLFPLEKIIVAQPTKKFQALYET